MGRSHLVCWGGGAEGRAAILRWAVGTVIWIAAAGLGSFGTAAAATLPDKDTTPPAVEVAGAPNLVVEKVSWRPTIIEEGSLIRFDYRVRNAGNAAAPASNVVLYRDAAPFVTQVLPPLAPGAVRNGGGVIEAVCGATVTINADAPNRVSESNETDDSWTMNLNCLQTGAGSVAPEMTAPATLAAAMAARSQADDNGSSTSPTPTAWRKRRSRSSRCACRDTPR